MDWSDEVRARLVREEERLRYKAANLQARGKTVMAAQELVVADDIRAALGEIERLKKLLALEHESGEQCRVVLQRAEAAEAQAEQQLQRADNEAIARELAEAKLAEEQAYARQQKQLRFAAEAEIERLREALVLVAEWKMPDTVGRDGKPSTYGLEYGSNGERDYVRGIARVALRGGEEHSKHPTGDYCVYCLSQWPCAEAGEVK